MLSICLCDCPFHFKIFHGLNLEMSLGVGSHIDFVIIRGCPKLRWFQAPEMRDLQISKRLATAFPSSFCFFQLFDWYPVAEQSERSCEYSRRPPRGFVKLT